MSRKMISPLYMNGQSICWLQHGLITVQERGERGRSARPRLPLFSLPFKADAVSSQGASLTTDHAVPKHCSRPRSCSRRKGGRALLLFREIVALLHPVHAGIHAGKGERRLIDHLAMAITLPLPLPPILPSPSSLSSYSCVKSCRGSERATGQSEGRTRTPQARLSTLPHG